MLVTMADHSEHAAGEGLRPLPRKAAKRRRIQLLEGSSSILQPYPCTEGAPPASPPTPDRRRLCALCCAELSVTSDCERPSNALNASLTASSCTGMLSWPRLLSSVPTVPHLLRPNGNWHLLLLQTGGSGVAVRCWRTSTRMCHTSLGSSSPSS